MSSSLSSFFTRLSFLIGERLLGLPGDLVTPVGFAGLLSLAPFSLAQHLSHLPFAALGVPAPISFARVS